MKEDIFQVELHEGCGRMKLFWIFLLVERRTLKAVVEFRNSNKEASGSKGGGAGECELFRCFQLTP